MNKVETMKWLYTFLDEDTIMGDIARDYKREVKMGIRSNIRQVLEKLHNNSNGYEELMRVLLIKDPNDEYVKQLSEQYYELY